MKRSAWFAAPLLAPALCCAQSNLVASAELDPVVVTAMRAPQPVSDVAAATIVIDREEIERLQATDVSDILAREVGLELGRNGGPGQQPASLFVRGGNSNYVVVLIDGVRMNEGALGAPALSNIAPEMIERIEIIEGPRAALYGADAVSGVINIITRKAGPARLDAEVGGGSFGTVQGGGSLRGEGRFGDHTWGAALSAQVQRSDGLPTYVGSDDDRGFRNRTVAGRAHIDLGPVRLEARGWDAGGNTQYSNVAYDANFNPVGFSALDHNLHNQTLALEASAHFLPNWFSALTFSRGEDHLDENQSGDYTRTVRPGADWHNVIDFGSRNRLSFGALGYRERVDAVSFGTPINESRTNVYGYLQDELKLGPHRLLGAVSYLSDSHFGKRFNWNAEYSYRLLPATQLVLASGSAFHAPAADDRFSGFGGNPNLQPEKALNFEAAVRQDFGPHQKAELRIFRTYVRDLITSIPAGPPAFNQLINLADARLEGVQGNWSYIDARWTARAGAIWQYPHVHDSGNLGAVGAFSPVFGPQGRLLRRARWDASGEIQRHLGRFDVGAAVRVQGNRPDSDAQTFTAVSDGGYALFDLNAGVRLTRELRLDVRVDNIFNHHYQTVAGYNQPGTAAYATLRYALPL